MRAKLTLQAYGNGYDHPSEALADLQLDYAFLRALEPWLASLDVIGHSSRESFDTEYTISSAADREAVVARYRGMWTSLTGKRQ